MCAAVQHPISGGKKKTGDPNPPPLLNLESRSVPSPNRKLQDTVLTVSSHLQSGGTLRVQVSNEKLHLDLETSRNPSSDSFTRSCQCLVLPGESE